MEIKKEYCKTTQEWVDYLLENKEKGKEFEDLACFQFLAYRGMTGRVLSYKKELTFINYNYSKKAYETYMIKQNKENNFEFKKIDVVKAYKADGLGYVLTKKYMARLAIIYANKPCYFNFNRVPVDIAEQIKKEALNVYLKLKKNTSSSTSSNNKMNYAGSEAL